jgi:hypothetical protein
MQSWRESGAGWLKVLRGLEKLKEVLFVRELFGRSGGGGYRLVELAEVDVAVYEFSGELWRARILRDLEKEKKVWLGWKAPKVEFMGIVEGGGSGEDREVDVCRRPRTLRDGSSWRIDRQDAMTLIMS